MCGGLGSSRQYGNERETRKAGAKSKSQRFVRNELYYLCWSLLKISIIMLEKHVLYSLSGSPRHTRTKRHRRRWRIEGSHQSKGCCSISVTIIHQCLLEALKFCLLGDVKGERGEEGPGGKLGAPVSLIQLLLFYCYCSTPLPKFVSSIH